MGVDEELVVSWRVHSDGCTIMSGYFETPLVRIDYYEKYGQGTKASRCLRALASWVDQVQSGERDEERLVYELELPFEDPPRS
jgi:hypothetical protein